MNNPNGKRKFRGVGAEEFARFHPYFSSTQSSKGLTRYICTNNACKYFKGEGHRSATTVLDHCQKFHPINSDVPIYKCDDCDAFFDNQSNWVLHRVNVHYYQKHNPSNNDNTSSSSPSSTPLTSNAAHFLFCLGFDSDDRGNITADDNAVQIAKHILRSGRQILPITLPHNISSDEAYLRMMQGVYDNNGVVVMENHPTHFLHTKMKSSNTVIGSLNITLGDLYNGGISRHEIYTSNKRHSPRKELFNLYSRIKLPLKKIADYGITTGDGGGGVHIDVEDALIHYSGGVKFFFALVQKFERPSQRVKFARYMADNSGKRGESLLNFLKNEVDNKNVELLWFYINEGSTVFVQSGIPHAACCLKSSSCFIAPRRNSVRSMLVGILLSSTVVSKSKDRGIIIHPDMRDDILQIPTEKVMALVSNALSSDVVDEPFIRQWVSELFELRDLLSDSDNQLFNNSGLDIGVRTKYIKVIDSCIEKYSIDGGGAAGVGDGSGVLRRR